MQLLTEEPVEFRRVRTSPSKSDPNKMNYYYTFEDDSEGSFQIFSRENFSGLLKGDMVNLNFATRLWDNKLQFDLIGVDKVG